MDFHRERVCFTLQRHGGLHGAHPAGAQVVNRRGFRSVDSSGGDEKSQYAGQMVLHQRPLCGRTGLGLKDSFVCHT